MCHNFVKTLFQQEHNGIKDYLLISILHTPRFPHLAWTLHGMSMEIEMEN